MIVIGTIVFMPILLILTLWFFYYFSSEKYLKKIPGPTPLPIIGNIHQIGTDAGGLECICRFQQKYGSIYKIRTMFDIANVFISDPKLAEEILKSHELLDKGATYDFFHSWLGTGLLTSTGKKWKEHRRMLTPSFHFKILEGFIDTFNKYGNVLISKLESEVGKSSFDVYPYMVLYTLDIICATSMGTNINAQKESDSEYVRCVEEMCRILTDRSVSIVKSIDFLYKFTEDYRIECKALRVLHKFTDSVIAKRKEELARNDTTLDDDNDSDLGIKKRLTLLDAILQYKQEGKGIPDKEIREQVDTFMFGGHDTTWIGISGILYGLALNQRVQETVVEEINSVLCNKSTDANYQDLQDMKYLEMVVKECLRLYPPVPIIARRMPKDTAIGEYILPKGTDVTINIRSLHLDPTYFPDPEKFSPERFTTEIQSTRPAHSYIPFSAGPRNCLAQKFAMLEMKAAVVKILKVFRVLPAIPDHTPRFGGLIVLKSENGVRIRLEKRKL
ncbi:hypothetical protein RI129_004604 [Pyrocoelia pectoralis]|uniref:Cytochrome P450 n=1 Tax=Pyrocoelia pectoralis TaxID=417401 RepID=A0AAN7VD67_9COLE